MKKHENDIAIDYLTVANELNKKSNSSIDFSDLIAHLKGINQKPFFKMEMSEFDNDIDNYYTLTHLCDLPDEYNVSYISDYFE